MLKLYIATFKPVFNSVTKLMKTEKINSVENKITHKNLHDSVSVTYIHGQRENLY